MKNTGQSAAPATLGPQETLRILQDVSHIYETAKRARTALAKDAQRQGATYQALGDAMGTDRSSAHTLVNGRAA